MKSNTLFYIVFNLLLIALGIYNVCTLHGPILILCAVGLAGSVFALSLTVWQFMKRR